MDTEILEDIGLTGAEIKVFISLLELGPTKAGKVVKKSGLQNAVVHRAFHSLIEKGLVTYVMKGKIRQYQAVEPRLILNYIDEKKQRLKDLIPKLEAKQKQSKRKPRARIFEGKRGVKELLNLTLDTDDKEYFSYGGAQKSDEVLDTWFWKQFHKKRVDKNIEARLLFHQSLRWWASELEKLKLTEIRLTEKNFEELTETVICGDKVGIIMWRDRPFGFLIEENLAANSYRRFFEIMWEQAK